MHALASRNVSFNGARAAFKTMHANNQGSAPQSVALPERVLALPEREASLCYSRLSSSRSHSAKRLGRPSA